VDCVLNRIRGSNGSTEQRLLTSAAEMRDTLENVFCITLPDVPELDSVLARLAA
jgi:hypothetical protein